MKIVQIGFSQSKLEFVDGADLWHCNGLHTVMPKEITPAGWFQIHREEDLYKESPIHLEWLKEEHPFPIWMCRRFDEYPSSVPLPYDELFGLWPFSFLPSFGSSFSWMVAMAIYLKYDVIAIEGVELMTPREAWLEAPNFMAWLGIAAGRGIQVSGHGRLFEPYLYGIEGRTAPAWLPMEIAQDVILDQIDEGRKLRNDWIRRRYYPEVEPTRQEAPKASVRNEGGRSGLTDSGSADS